MQSFNIVAAYWNMKALKYFSRYCTQYHSDVKRKRQISTNSGLQCGSL